MATVPLARLWTNSSELVRPPPSGNRFLHHTHCLPLLSRNVAA